MANYIGKLVALITADTAGFTAGVNKAKEETTAFKRAVEHGGRSEFMGEMQHGLHAIIPQLAAIGTIAGTLHFGKQLVDEATEISHAAEFLGLRVREYQNLSTAAYIAGHAMEGFKGAIVKLQQGMAALAGGSLAFGDAIKLLRLDPDQLQLMSTAEQLKTVVRAMSELENASLRNALGVELFGRSWKQVGETLMAGAEGVPGGQYLFERSPEGIKAAKEFGEAMRYAWHEVKTGAAIAADIYFRFGAWLAGIDVSQKSVAREAEREARARKETAETLRRLREEKEWEKGWQERSREEGARLIADMEERNRLDKEAADEEKRLQKEATDAVKQARSEEEKFADAARQAHEWLKLGRITAAEEAKLIKKAQGDLLKSWESETKFEPAKLARKGTAEEYEVVAKIQSAILGRDEQLSRLAAIEANTRGIIDAVKGADKIKVVSAPP